MQKVVIITFLSIVFISCFNILHCQVTENVEYELPMTRAHSVVVDEITQTERDLYIQFIQSANNKTMLYTTLIFLFFSLINLATIFVVLYPLLLKKDRDILDRLTKIENDFVSLKDSVDTTITNFKCFCDKLDVDMCRSLYITSITNRIFEEAFAWGLRVIYGECVRKERRYNVIESFIENTYNVSEELLTNPIDYIHDIDTFREIVSDKIHVLIELSKCEEVEKDYRDKSVKIYNNIIHILSLKTD